MNLKQRFKNALWAQAVCDAVGDPFEFDIDPEPDDVLDYANNSETLKITDDTQMALFGAEAIHYAKTGNNIVDIEHQLKMSYAQWYTTQSENFSISKYQLGLLQFESLWHRRAPGLTCLDSCSKLKADTSVINNSKGCGSVMRVLPFVIFRDELTTIQHALTSAKLTHQHVENEWAIYKLMNAYHWALNDDFQNRSWEQDEHQHISDLGTGWTALECVNMAIYANLHAKSFDDLLTLSICHGGDSDSVAAIAGSIWGLCGKDVPIKYKQKIVESDAINYILNLETYRE